MRICVFGAGAIGGNYATRLADAGNEVSVVARGPHLEAIRANGLTLLTGDRKIVARVKASDRPADLGPQDVVISTLKASSLSAIADTVAPLLGPGTPVVFAQNGIPWWYGHGLGKERPKAPDLSRLDPGGALLKAVGFDRTLGGVITSSNHVIEPGVVRNISPDRNVLWVGEPDDRQTPRIQKLRETLIAAGISSPSTTDIRYDIWHKLMANFTGSTLCLILRQPTTIQATPMVNGSRAAPMPRRWPSPPRTASCSTIRPSPLRPQARLSRPSSVDPAGLRGWTADGDRGDRAGAARLRAQRRSRHAHARRDRIDLRQPRGIEESLSS